MTDKINPAERKPLLTVSWSDFHRHAYELAHILRKKGSWRAIVAITRGGLTPAQIVARELDMRLVGVMSIASYHDYLHQGALEVLQGVSKEILAVAGDRGEGLLFVDDLADTGATFREVAHHFPKAHRAAVYAKQPNGTLHCQTSFIMVDGDTWIRLPWDTNPQTLEYRDPMVTVTALNEITSVRAAE